MRALRSTISGDSLHSSEGLPRSRNLLRCLLLASLSTGGAILLWLCGALNGGEESVRNLLFAASARQASGQLHVVEMDAASLDKIDQWPWPRRHYAEVVDQLSAAGARSITFDVDFSTPSEAQDDSRFEEALAASKSTIVLPTFAQRASQSERRMLDALPIPQFRRSAILGSVAVAPDGDGFVRRMPLGTMTAGVPRPSLSAQIAGRAGKVGQAFPLDLSIDPQSVPRHSFAAVERGDFRPDDVKGKDVLIGATAIEMGDRYAVPRFGVLPGVVVQAIAAETLYSAVPANSGPIAALLLALGLSVFIAGSASKRRVLILACSATLSVIVLYWSAWVMVSVLLEIVPAFFATALVSGARLAELFRYELQERRAHDAQTGLPNRIAMDKLRDANVRASVVAIIDGFETLHTVLGDDLVSKLVKRVSERLAAGSGGQTIYRLEDRILAWPSLVEGATLETILAQISTDMRRPIEVAGRQIDVQLAFGIARPGALAEAAHAAFQAQKHGEHWRHHLATENSALERQVSLMGELDEAITQRQIEVVYQPKLQLASDRVASVEALVRWNHPKRGYLRPDMFIPLAEEADRICDLTLYVLERTIKDLSDWCAKGVVVTAAVNISARLVTSQAFLVKAEDLLQRSGVPRQRLIFEVTELATITDRESATKALGHFRELGVAISMDDYGTGQSTLTYLKQLPLSELKIDRSFVQNAHCDRNDALLVRSTIELAHELGLSVVAEGVEDAECLEFLREVGCDYAQGYLIGKPMSADQLRKLVSVTPSLAA